MARQTGVLKFEGTIDEIIFYKRNGKYYARKKGAPSREKLKKGKEFENSRRVSAEFGHASKIASKLYRSCKGILNSGRHDGLHGKLTSILNRVIQSDPISEYGKRKLGLGELKLLEGTSFEKTNLKSIVDEIPSVIFSNNQLQINFIELGSIKRKSLPIPATHYRINILWCRINEANYDTKFRKSETVPLMIDQPLSINGLIKMDLEEPLEVDDVLIVIFGIEFLQEINDELNELTENKAVTIINGFTGKS